MDEWCNDENLIAELDTRSSDLKTGKDLGVSWEELKNELFSSTRNGL